MESFARNSIPSLVESLNDDDDKLRVLGAKRKAEKLAKAKSPTSDEDDDRLLWTTKVLNKFLEAMIEEVYKGHRTSTTFSKEGWNVIFNVLKDYNIGKIQCKNKFNKLRKEYSTFKKLSEEIGVVVNFETGIVRAEDGVWDQLKKVIKDCGQFRKNGCPYYVKLQVIFGDNTTVSHNVHPLTKMHLDSEYEDDSDEVEEVGQEEEEDDELVEVKTEKRVKKERVKGDAHTYSFASSLEYFIQQMAENAKKRTEILEKQLVQAPQTSETVGESGCGTLVKVNKDLEQYLEAIDALNELEDVDGPSYAKAMKVLREDTYLRTAFMRLPRQRRKDFVIYF